MGSDFTCVSIPQGFVYMWPSSPATLLGASSAGDSAAQCGPTSCPMRWSRPSTHVSENETSWSTKATRLPLCIDKVQRAPAQAGINRLWVARALVTITPLPRPSTGFTRLSFIHRRTPGKSREAVEFAPLGWVAGSITSACCNCSAIYRHRRLRQTITSN